MRVARLFGCGVAVVLALGVARPYARPRQDPQTAAPQQPMFKSSTALVEVDATVLDGKGEFMKGLTADDFELFEDGKPQKIQQFFLVSHDAGLNAGTNALEAADPNAPEQYARRVFVLLFDEADLANDSLMRVKKGAEQFVTTYMQEGDVGGVVVDGEMFKDRLTTDKYELANGIRTVRPAFDNRQALLASFRDFPRIPSEYDAQRIADGAIELVNQLAAQACVDSPSECAYTAASTRSRTSCSRKPICTSARRAC